MTAAPDAATVRLASSEVRSARRQPDLVTELVVTGMTCRACSARIERRLGRLDGVEASVNFTSGRARVSHTASHGVADLVAVVVNLGFGATAVDPADLARVRPAAAAGQGETSSPAEPGRPGDGLEPAGELEQLRHRVLVCLTMTVPVVVVAMVPAAQFRYWQWFTLVLAAPVVVWGGWRFHRSALCHLRHRSLTMDTLVSLGSMTALAWSVLTLFLGDAGLGGVRHGLTLVPSLDPYAGTRTIYLEVAAAIVTAVLIGRWLELRGRRAALADGGFWAPRPRTDACLLVGDRELRVPVDVVGVGDRVLVAAGEVLPCDGRVVAGDSTLDVSTMTGEATPVEVAAGTRVLAGSVNGPGRLVVAVDRTGEATQWAHMARRVRDAQVGKATAQRLADRVAGRFVPGVLLLAAWTFGYWCYAHDAVLGLVATISVLVVACPCALGLATPTALAVAVGRGAQLGILLSGPRALETSRRIDTVVLDKTGTVTTGVMAVHDVTVVGDVGEHLVRRRVAALERDVEHPVAAALRALTAADDPTASAVATEVELVDGLGVRGRVDGVEVLVGRPLLLERAGVLVPEELVEAARRAQESGHTVVLVAWRDAGDDVCTARAVIALGDDPRPTAASAVRRLQALGLRTILLTGDHTAAAGRVAAAVGIGEDEVIAEVLPTGKADVVAELQRGGAVVAMVGDGVNDAAALARAELGLAMGSGSGLALHAADLALVRNDLECVPTALELARATARVIRLNLFWAFVYNLAALPLAVLGLLNPMIASVAMGASSVFVVANSLRLRRFRRRCPRARARDSMWGRARSARRGAGE